MGRRRFHDRAVGKGRHCNDYACGAVHRLGSRKAPTGQVPVIYDPRVSSGLIHSLAGAISGPSIARGTSFLKDQLGKKIMPDTVTVIDELRVTL